MVTYRADEMEDRVGSRARPVQALRPELDRLNQLASPLPRHPLWEVGSFDQYDKQLRNATQVSHV